MADHPLDALPVATDLVGASTYVVQSGVDKQAPASLFVVPSQVREKLTANRTYYVRTDGSDSNDGLSNASGGAFLTLQKAWNTVAALDLSIYSVTIKVTDGTYTAGINMSAMPVGGSNILIEGNTTTPGNVHINVTNAHCFVVTAPLPCLMNINGFKCSFSGSSRSAIQLWAPGQITTSRMELAGGSTGYAGAYFAVVAGARIIVSTSQLISGSMSCFVQAGGGGQVIFHGITVTLTGTPAWGWAGVVADSFGFVNLVGVTFSGSATGMRYSAGLNGGINTSGGGASFIPGSSSGSASSPSWYS